MFKQDFQKTYVMIHPSERYAILQRIHRKEIVSETVVGKTQEWWLKKHNPDQDIPKHIYLLGQGTIRELYDTYTNQYGAMEWEEFINYTRELIKQNIMV
jgi:hypothetical protein